MTPDHILDKLHEACRRGSVLDVESILKVCHDVDDFITFTRCTALSFAARAGSKEICQLLLAKGADPNKASVDSLPLVLAAGLGHVSTCEVLIANGADPNKEAMDGYLPLVMAAGSGHASTCEVLIAAGAEMNRPDSHGRRPLTQASWHGHIDAVRVLCERGANPNLTDSAGFAPLDHAAENQSTPDGEDHTGDITRLLVKHGANIDHCPTGCEGGLTVLMNSAKYGNLEGCILLKHLGASELIKNQRGQTAVDIAREGGHADVVRFLTEGALPVGYSPPNGDNAKAVDYDFQYRVWKNFSDVSEFARRCAKDSAPITVKVVDGGWIVENWQCEENEEGFDPYINEAKWQDQVGYADAEAAVAAELAEHRSVGPLMEGWRQSTEFD